MLTRLEARIDACNHATLPHARAHKSQARHAPSPFQSSRDRPIITRLCNVQPPSLASILHAPVHISTSSPGSCDLLKNRHVHTTLALHAAGMHNYCSLQSPPHYTVVLKDNIILGGLAQMGCISSSADSPALQCIALTCL